MRPNIPEWRHRPSRWSATGATVLHGAQRHDGLITVNGDAFSQPRLLFEGRYRVASNANDTTTSRKAAGSCTCSPCSRAGAPNRVEVVLERDRRSRGLMKRRFRDARRIHQPIRRKPARGRLGATGLEADGDADDPASSICRNGLRLPPDAFITISRAPAHLPHGERIAICRPSDRQHRECSVLGGLDGGGERSFILRRKIGPVRVAREVVGRRPWTRVV